MRVLISGGGTGGHIYPALAVASQLVKEYQAEVLYLGSDDGLETEVVPAAGFPLAVIKAGKLRRYISWRTLTGVARVPVGMGQAIGIVRDFRPQVAFTSGGYVAVPAGLAARINGVPLLMHQQDVPPNLSNRLIAPLATRISVAFEDSLAYFPRAKTRQLGNPIRQEMLDARQMSPQEARSQLGFEQDGQFVLVTGGSQGARHLNEVVCRSLLELLPHCRILHISVLVPLPPAIGNSPQEANAEMFKRKQAALVVRDIDLRPEVLVARVLSILASRATLQSMAEAARTFAAPEATQGIADEVMQIAKSGRHNHESVVR
jgi:UDP-N-acetylglucosamine--N-acetylmuramyl-(pentapeptide) pyrophosphoryl-undecaprenol N-acetylglucosamine transferase